MLDAKEKVKILEEELKRKDKIIEELREQNQLLMNTAIKRTKERIEKNSITK